MIQAVWQSGKAQAVLEEHAERRAGIGVRRASGARLISPRGPIPIIEDRRENPLSEPALPGIEAVYEVNERGWQQLQGSSTMLPGAALSLLVLINGKLSLAQIATHLKDLPEEKLRKMAFYLEQKGFIQPVKTGEPAKAGAFDVIDFFAGQSSAPKAGGAESDEDAARRLREEAKSFTAMLQLRGYAVRIARQVGETVRPASGDAYSVLYVDDTPTLTSAVCKFLELEGFVPHRAANREQVVAELRRAPPPDLILLDVDLPDISGFDILLRVRGHPALKHMPIIMVTGKTTREDVMRALVAGANGYITKPFEMDALMNAIKAVLGLGLPDKESGGA
jgi:two-component system OmpR family response regulator